MKFTLINAFAFNWPGLKGWAYNSKSDFPNASASIFEVENHHGKVKTTLSDRVYYILEGKGEFIIAGETIAVEPSDVIIVPKNTEYDYKGKMRLFLVHIPAYDESFEIQLDKT
jgi:mannose-6-phosphate isomerase-like protein (cupin superfamily)